MVKEVEEKVQKIIHNMKKSSDSTKELCRPTTTTLMLSGRRFCLLESLTNKGCIAFRG
jgi:hypothetical protein